MRMAQRVTATDADGAERSGRRSERRPLLRVVAPAGEPAVGPDRAGLAVVHAHGGERPGRWRRGRVLVPPLPPAQERAVGPDGADLVLTPTGVAERAHRGERPRRRLEPQRIDGVESPAGKRPVGPDRAGELSGHAHRGERAGRGRHIAPREPPASQGTVVADRAGGPPVFGHVYGGVGAGRPGFGRPRCVPTGERAVGPDRAGVAVAIPSAHGGVRAAVRRLHVAVVVRAPAGERAVGPDRAGVDLTRAHRGDRRAARVGCDPCRVGGGDRGGCDREPNEEAGDEEPDPPPGRDDGAGAHRDILLGRDPHGSGPPVARRGPGGQDVDRASEPPAERIVRGR